MSPVLILPQVSADMNKLDGRGDSALHIAARHDKGTAVKALVEVS